MITASQATYDRACLKLREGLDGTHQPKRLVRIYLRELERDGFVMFSDGAWWLTSAGIAARDRAKGGA